MSKLAEISLAHHLINTESLEYLVAEGLDGELIPTVPIREMVGWALSYFAQNGFRVAPTYEVMREEFGDRLDDQEIDLEDEPTSSIEWAVEALKESHVRQHSQEWARNFVTDVSTAGPGDSTVEILASHTQKLLGFSTSLESQVYRVEGDEGLMTALRLFEDRANDLQDVRGLRLGFPVIDSYTHGIHRGELAVLAAGPKTGKSFALAFSALNEWRAGHDVVLVTLENSIAMTWDRIACMATNISYLDWQEGTSLPDEVELVREFHRSVAESPTKFVVIQPPLGRRNFDSMVAEARIYKAQALFIDQLTFVEMPDPRKAKTERIGDALHQLKGLISVGRNPIPCLLAHQINREGVKAADKVGHLEMYHLADSSEVERTADWVFGLYASRADKASKRAKFQVLAARRASNKQWNMRWDVDLGDFGARDEFIIDQ